MCAIAAGAAAGTGAPGAKVAQDKKAEVQAWEAGPLQELARAAQRMAWGVGGGGALLGAACMYLGAYIGSAAPAQVRRHAQLVQN